MSQKSNYKKKNALYLYWSFISYHLDPHIIYSATSNAILEAMYLKGCWFLHNTNYCFLELPENNEVPSKDLSHYKQGSLHMCIRVWPCNIYWIFTDVQQSLHIDWMLQRTIKCPCFFIIIIVLKLGTHNPSSMAALVHKLP